MNQLFLIALYILISEVALCQTLKLPEKPYVIVLGNYKFNSETIIEKSPDLSESFGSEIFGGIQLKMQSDTIRQKPIYVNGDSLRISTYLYRKDSFRINYPTKIRRVRVRNNRSDSIYIRHDTTDHIYINKFVDTLNLAELNSLLFSKVKIYNGTKRLKIRRIGVRLVWPDGKQFYTNYEKARISDYPKMVEMTKTLSPNGYLILDSVWFYNLKKEQDIVDGAVGWLIQ